MLIQSQPHIEFEITFFKYEADGWRLSTQDDCRDVHYFNMHEHHQAPDKAASARAIACLKGIKRSNKG